MILPRFTDLAGNRAQLRARTTVESYSNAAIGGPKQAQITLSGSEADIWQAIDTIGWQVDLHNEAGDWRWGGRVVEAKVTAGAITHGVSLKQMANRVQITYTAHTLDASGQEQQSQEFTLWASDSESIATYGTQEARLTFGDSTEAAAEAYRDIILSQSKVPVATTELASNAGKATAVLECRGYWDTTNNRYLADSLLTSGIIDATPVVIGSIMPGSFPQPERRGQRIYPGSSTALAAATFVVQKIGAPTGSLRCELWYGGLVSDPGLNPVDTPSILVSYVDLDLDQIADPTTEGVAEPAAVTWNFPNAALSTTRANFVILSLAGGTFSDVNYINVSMSANGGPVTGTPFGAASAGVRGFSDGTWQANYIESTAYDLLYSVVLTRETTALIAERVDSHAAMLEGTLIEQASGIYASAYEDGQSRLQDVLEGLLSMGSTTSGRLLAKVNQDKLLIVYPEPLKSVDPTYEIGRDGQLRTPLGQPVAKDLCPAGVWVRIVGVIPVTAYGARLADASMIFLEECEYNAANDTLTPHARGTRNPWSIGG